MKTIPLEPKLKMSHLQRLKMALGELFQKSLVFFISMALLRILERYIVPNADNVSSTVFFTGLNYDLLFSGGLTFLVSLFYIPLFYILSSLARVFVNTVFLLVLLAHCGLLLYFKFSAIPLGGDLFGYSVDEILLTTRASGGLNVVSVGILIAVPLIYLLAFQGVRRWVRISGEASIGFWFGSIILLWLAFALMPEPQDYKNEWDYYVGINKPAFFLSKSLGYMQSKSNDFSDSREYILYDNETWNSRGKLPEGLQAFPFLHQDETKDILSPSFNFTEGKPDLVFIIVESLGKAYSGPNAYLGSFTPFLDSLAQQGLYWENCLSAGGRTFAVLPTIFGSLPFLEKGFLEDGEKAPRSASLFKVLKCNGYETSFYYGSEASFDKMDIYLKGQEVNVALEKKSFPSSYTPMPASPGGDSWGYADKDLFKRYFEMKKNGSAPLVDVLLTVSNHSPFIIEDQDVYRNKVRQKINTLHLSKEKMRYLNTYEQQLSTVMYTDEAIRYFINTYAKLPGFSNTVFIITGDHRMPEMPIATQIDRFHVPLIIYSPALKQSRHYKGVSSHFDITPSLLALLRRNFSIQMPVFVHWIGSNLDTSLAFRCVKAYPFMRNKNEIADFLQMEYFLGEDRLFKLADKMNINEYSNPLILKKMKKDFHVFIQKNKELISSRKLEPDTLSDCK